MTTRSSHVISSAALLVALVSSVFVPSLAGASEFRTGESPSHAAGETLSEDLYLIGPAVTSAGTMRGDLIGFGGNVLVSGPVYGDIAAGGGTVSILGDVSDDVRVAGGTVTVQGAVAGDILAGGGQITISSSKVGGDVTIGGGVVRIDSTVVGDMRLAGGDIRINGTVDGNVDIQAETITLGPKAVINGTFTYKSPTEAVLESGAVVRGETAYTKSPDVREAAKAGLVAFVSLWFVAKVFMVFTGAVVVAYVFPRYSRELVTRTMTTPLSHLGRGVVFAIVTPIISVLLLFTVIGLMFGILGLLLYVSAMIFAAMITPLILGSLAHKLMFKAPEYEVNIKTVLIGTVLYVLAGLVPVIGGIAIFAMMLLALGAAISIKTQVLGEWR